MGGAKTGSSAVKSLADCLSAHEHIIRCNIEYSIYVWNLNLVEVCYTW